MKITNEQYGNNPINPTGDHNNVQPDYGITLRDYFAGLAMQGLLSNLASIRREGFKDSEIAEFARIQADNLIYELNS